MTNSVKPSEGNNLLEQSANKLIYGLVDDTETQIVAALKAGRQNKVKQLLKPIHYADLADLLERLDQGHRERMVNIIRPDFNAEILTELDGPVLEHIVAILGIKEVATAITALASNDAVEVLENLKEQNKQLILDSIPKYKRTLVEEAFTYPGNSAGRLMLRELVIIPESWTIEQVIGYVRINAGSENNLLPDQFFIIYVVDPTHRPVGILSIDQLLRNQGHVFISTVMTKDFKTVPTSADQENVALLFRQRDLVAAPVIDEGGRLVGAISIDDIVDVIDEENEEDLMRLGGIGEDDLYDAAIDTVKARFSWLLVNLITALIASSVIGFFNATIEQMVALAVLMPIVASMGGNAGTQTLTVSVRALAMRQLTTTNAMRVIGKEFLVGGFNGALFALLTGLIAWFWFGNPILALVIGLAMVVNMLVAGLAGAAIPLALARGGIDPAIASSVFLTTITDVVGFFSFLGLAAVILL